MQLGRLRCLEVVVVEVGGENLVVSYRESAAQDPEFVAMIEGE